jgi:hypothetical protein
MSGSFPWLRFTVVAVGCAFFFSVRTASRDLTVAPTYRVKSKKLWILRSVMGFGYGLMKGDA